MAKNNFRKKQEHKLKVKLKKMSKGLTKAVDRVDALLDWDIAQIKN